MIPKSIRPGAGRYGLVVKVSADGSQVTTLQDPSGNVASMVASVTEHGGDLYVCSFTNDYMGRLTLSNVEDS